MKVSVVIPVVSIDAAPFERALLAYAHQVTTLPWEIVAVTDHAPELHGRITSMAADHGLTVQIVPGPQRTGKIGGGDAAKVNHGSSFAHGEVIISTGPGVLLPSDAVQRLYDLVHQHDGVCVTATPFEIPAPPEQWPAGWAANVHRLRTLPGFYDGVNRLREGFSQWRDYTCWAMKMSRWRWLGGFNEGVIHAGQLMDFRFRLQIAGIPTLSATSHQSSPLTSNLTVYEQPRTHSDVRLGLEPPVFYRSVGEMRASGGLHQHQGRERVLTDVLVDVSPRARALYEQVLPRVRGLTVLDLPCGTGYGADLIGGAVDRYFGFDLDSESIEWAQEQHKTTKTHFQAVACPPIPMGEQAVDAVLCFQGIECFEGQQELVNEFARVLKPGGSVHLATPRKGSDLGTVWGPHLLTGEQLAALFSHWASVEWTDLPLLRLTARKE